MFRDLNPSSTSEASQLPSLAPTLWSAAAAADPPILSLAASLRQGAKSKPRGRSSSNNNNNNNRATSRSRKPLLIGKKISDGRMSWKGADKTSHFYVGQVHVDEEPQNIVDDIESLGVRVIEFEEIRRIPNRYKSF